MGYRKPPIPEGPQPVFPDLEHCVEDLAVVLRETRPWHFNQQRHHALHPVVLDLVKRGLRPADWHLMVLEWPHVSTSDKTMLAYTPDDQKAERGIVVRTTPGKYVRRHWPCLTDVEIRDVVARVSSDGLFQWRDTSDEIVDAVQNGPGSCMRWDPEEFECGDPDSREYKPHPYRVYDPALGWRMAVRFNEHGRIDGRCLVYAPKGEQPVYVRSFRRCFDSVFDPTSETYSQADEALEAWLKAQGVAKCYSWPDGTKLAKVMWAARNEPIVPYIDGDHHYFDIREDHLEVNETGEYQADDTDGCYGEADDDDVYTCSCCDQRRRGYPAIYAGVYEDDPVCDNCEDEYVQVTGRGGSTYYLHGDSDNVVEVGDDHYDKRYLSNNGIVELADGEYAKEDHTFCCSVTGKHYLWDDGIETEDNGRVHSDHAWQCAGSGAWYSSEVASVLVDGQEYHPDNVPDTAESEDDDDENPFDAPTTLTDVYAVAADAARSQPERNGTTALHPAAAWPYVHHNRS